ncbi:hypothetical protein LSAT2_026273, partial [Lamellibrachia satsuma]
RHSVDTGCLQALSRHWVSAGTQSTLGVCRHSVDTGCLHALSRHWVSAGTQSTLGVRWH